MTVPILVDLSVLTHTSKLIELFNRKENITSTSDRSLKDLDHFYTFMREWREKPLKITITLSQTSPGLMCSQGVWDLDPWWP